MLTINECSLQQDPGDERVQKNGKPVRPCVPFRWKYQPQGCLASMGVVRTCAEQLPGVMDFGDNIVI
jgi:hypothetical protein